MKRCDSWALNKLVVAVTGQLSIFPPGEQCRCPHSENGVDTSKSKVYVYLANRVRMVLADVKVAEAKRESRRSEAQSWIKSLCSTT